jgi:hypothetical protein
MLRIAPLLCLIAAGAAIVLGVVGQVAHIGPPLAVWMACFLVAFGLAKGLVAVEKLAALKLVPSGGPDPRADFANPTLFWAFIATKFTVFLVAWGVAGFLLQHPSAFVPR